MNEPLLCACGRGHLRHALHEGAALVLCEVSGRHPGDCVWVYCEPDALHDLDPDGAPLDRGDAARSWVRRARSCPRLDRSTELGQLYDYGAGAAHEVTTALAADSTPDNPEAVRG